MRNRLFVAATLVLMSSLALAGSEAQPQQQVAESTATSKAAAKTIAMVDEKLVQPLAERDEKQSRFSRARLPPTARRVRIVDDNAQHDSAGNAFFAFAIDARRGWSDDDDKNWNKAAITGCVYPERGEVFIKRGNAFHPAAAAVGKKTKAASEDTCRAAARVSAR